MTTTSAHRLSFLFIASALALTTISKVYFSHGPHFEGGMSYVVFSLAYFILVLCWNRRIKFEDSSLNPIPLWAFMVGTLILMGGSPSFETDHYRYLWEGRVLLKGENPYIHPPFSLELKHISFQAKKYIDYPYFTTVYPPLALIWFGLGGVFDFFAGLKILMILNAVLVWYFLKIAKNCGCSIYHLVLAIPLLQKEFIQAIHIDLLAAFFLCLTFWKMAKSKSTIWRILLVYASVCSKIIALVAIPFIFLSTPLNRRFIAQMAAIFMTAVGLLAVLYTLFVDNLGQLSGFVAFSKLWYWHSIIYEVFYTFLDFSHQTSRLVCLGLYGLYTAILWCIYVKLSVNIAPDKKLQLLANFLYLLFSGLMFFSPVFNSWYSVWFLFFALVCKNMGGVLFATTSAAAYISFPDVELRFIGMLLNYPWFFVSIISAYKAIRGLSEGSTRSQGIEKKQGPSDNKLMHSLKRA